jgi:seryl-tRNA synthetase
MLDLSVIRDEPRRVREAMRAKGHDNVDVVDTLLDVDESRRAKITALQEAQERSNTISRKIGTLKREGKEEEAQAAIEETGALKQRIKTLQSEVDALNEEQKTLLLEIPNLPHPSVPVGHTEAAQASRSTSARAPGCSGRSSTSFSTGQARPATRRCSRRSSLTQRAQRAPDSCPTRKT